MPDPSERRRDYEPTNEQYLQLIDMRGGCRCFISPPCSACCEPMEEWEAEALGIEPPITSEPVVEISTEEDIMSITRRMFR